MRLEVLSGTKGAVVYVLNRPEVYIGSRDTNDIVIASPEVSKKHLKLIVTDDGKCVVIDQGSTNGTYLNDERLIPGRREVLPFFTSLRLGDSVLLTLLDKDRGDLPSLPLRDKFVEEKKVTVTAEDKTRVISLKTLQKTKTAKVRKKRLKTLEKELKKKKQVRQDKALLNRAISSAVGIMLLAFVGWKYWDVHKKKKERTTIAGSMKESQYVIDDRIETLEDSSADNHIPQSSLLSLREISEHAEDLGCALPEEEFFCKRLPPGSKKKNMAVTVRDQMVIYLEQEEYLEKAQGLVTFYSDLNRLGNTEASSMPERDLPLDDDENAASPAEENSGGVASMETLNRIATLIYLKEKHWRPLPVDYHKHNLYFVLYSHVGTEIQVKSVLAIKGHLLNQVTARFTEDFFRFRKYNPFRIISRLDRFYRFY